jgi:glycosyl transferase family 25
MMRIFVINLEKDKKRRQSIQMQLDQINCPFEFINGVLGKSIPENELSLIYNKKKAFRNHCRELTRSEIGCAMSHINVYKKIITENIPMALILEDDVILPDSLPNILIEFENYLNPNNPDLILLSDASVYLNKEKKIYEAHIYPFKSGYYTSSYILTNLSAKILVSDLFPIKDVADCWQRLKKNKILNIFAIKPALIIQDQELFGSSTTMDIQLSINKRACDILTRKLFRLFWVTVNSIVSVYNRSINPYKGLHKTM